MIGLLEVVVTDTLEVVVTDSLQVVVTDSLEVVVTGTLEVVGVLVKSSVHVHDVMVKISVV